MIEFACPECGAVSEFGDGAAGSRVRCPDCRTSIFLPFDAPTSPEAIVEPTRPAKYRRRKPPPPSGPVPRGHVICPNVNCGYRGKPRYIARGSTAVGCLLLLFVFPIGLFYFILRSGHRKLCPQCGLHLSSGA
jgi:hypothetical protein